MDVFFFAVGGPKYDAEDKRGSRSGPPYFFSACGI